MKTYSQLTFDLRCQISTLLQEGLSQTQIANRVGCSQPSVSREIKRNSGQRGYRYKQADALAKVRRQSTVKRYKMTPSLITLIDEKLGEMWSPEQISGWLKRERNLLISHESIYLHVWEDKRQGGELYLYLRHKVKGYRSRSGVTGSRGKIPNRVSIDDRPAIVDTRSRVGDWEIDLIIGKGHSGAMLTIVERKTRFTVAAVIEDKSAKGVTAATIALLEPLKDYVLTITADNGKEFSGHQEMAKMLNADVYFADPYSSWQRGINENTNGLLRQYWPKITDFKTVDEIEVETFITQLNNRPRKILEYQTPADTFSLETAQ
jgi:IS30 family transposase